MVKIDIPKSIIDALLSHTHEGIVAIDLETTGLSPLTDKIIEIAAIKIDDDGNVHTFEQLINPQIDIPEYTTAIHGIKNSDIENSPTIDQVIPQLIKFIGRAPIVAHNAKFDIGFIVCAMNQCQIPFGENAIYDSCQLARHYYRGKTDTERPISFRLNDLASYLKIPLENHHRALDDTLASLWIFSNCITLLKRRQQSRKIDDNGILFHLDAFKKLQDYDLPENLEPLLVPMATQTIVEIYYEGKSKSAPPQRPIRPIGLIPMPQGAVLYAQCVLTTAMKTFPLRKIKSVTIIPDKEVKRWQTHLDNLKEEKAK